MSVFPAWPADPPLRRLFVRDLVILARIGVHPHEVHARQRVRINIDFGVLDDAAGAEPGRDDLARTVSYERVAAQARELATADHVRLVETLAERLAAAVLSDPRILVVRVRVEKLDVFPDAAAVGVEIERRRPAPPAG